MEDSKELSDDVKELFIEKDSDGNCRLSKFGTFAIIAAILGMHSYIFNAKSKVKGKK